MRHPPLVDPDPQPEDCAAPQTPTRRAASTLLLLARTAACTAAYVPFVFSLLWQSLLQGRSVETTSWKEELTAGSWAVGSAGFCLQAAWIFCFALLRWPLWPLLAWVAAHNASIARYTLGRPELCALQAAPPGQRPPRIRWGRLANQVQLCAAVVELLQLTAAGAQPVLLRFEREPSSSGISPFFRVASSFLPHWTAGLRSDAELGLVVAAMVLYSLLVGYWIAAKRRDTPALIFDFLPGACYVTVVTQVLAAVGEEFAGGAPLLEPKVVLAILLPWLSYVNTATFVATYRWDEVTRVADIVYAPLFLCIERNVKGLLAIAVIYLRGMPRLCGCAVLLLDAVLLSGLVAGRARFCATPGFAALRAASVLVATWVDVCSLLVVLVMSDQVESAKDLWLALVFGGWMLLLLAWVLKSCGHCLMSRRGLDRLRR